MQLSIDPASGIPLFDQIADGLRRALAEGTLQVGEHLPPAKDLAAALRVNLHTVLRAYAQLRDEGLAEVRRGRGTVIISAGTPGMDRRLNQAAVRLAVEARRLGVSEDDLTTLVLRAFRQNTGCDSISD
uniref:GntR family transcriptional regulator n=1 Tax=Herbidospora sakaeratensis TaxID=564415 RepID=UPI0007818FDB|nr:GntR family transcriptional regulator [Herbidospora sakaeratensis]